MINIKYNKDVIVKLCRSEFYPDTMMTSVFALQCLMNEEIDLLDMLDDYNSSKRMMLVYYDLVRKGFLEEIKDSGTTAFRLTPEGELFIKSLDDLSNGKVVKAKDDTEEWFNEWFELFPKGVRSGGKLLRSDAKATLAKMKKFRKDYKYSKDVILEATKRYLRMKEAKNWEYTKCATYFIHKQGEGSVLAEECENLINKSPKTQTEERINNLTTGLV